MIINLSIDGSQVIRISEFESFNVTGTAGDDRILGGDAGNILIGGDGDDLLRGGTGIDILNGGDGDDVLDNAGVGDIVEGGAGMDLINLKVDDETIDLTINLLTGEAPGGSWTGAELLQGQLGSGNDNVTVGMQLYNLLGVLVRTA